MLLAELRHLWRQSAFLHYQKTVSFLGQLIHRQMFVIILELSLQVRRKTMKDPLSIDAVGTVDDVFDSSQEARGLSTISHEILEQFFFVPYLTVWYIVAGQQTSSKPVQQLR